MIKKLFTKNKKLICILFILLSFTYLLKYFNEINTDIPIFNVNVPVDPMNSNIKNSIPKEVYLTFDDGPIPIITDALLDVLKKYNVKATFFIVGKEIDGREDILKRICSEGHSIGLHTYSHNFKKIYTSDDAFINEMLETQLKIKELTGCSSTIIRFPGGSSKRLSNELLNKLHKNNLKVFDWNLSLEDGINGSQSVNTLIRKSSNYKENWSKIILLMHCNSNNKNTVLALPSIIKNYQDSGYEIKPITKDTEEYIFKIRK